MTDEGITDPVKPTGEPTPPVVTAPLVNAEGVLRENWRESLDEDIRGEKVFDRVNDFHGVMKSLASAERAFGKDKIAVPNEASTEAEIEAFHIAGGRPDTPADYGFQRPDDFPEELWSDEAATSWQELFHKEGVNRKQANAILAKNLQDTSAAFASQQTDHETMMAEVESGLYAEWGNAT